ncbi:DUF1653 domain-containing protein [Hydrogenophaga sp. YM1]|nr:DUF1653 domain-containing protein [Hydrogenophaga sp.]QRR35377.1 DUF1653 domain-containing protein [Hydrogenophaga sp. YM1]
MNDDDLPPLTPTPPGLYRHYKGGWYEVIDTVRCSETLQPLVLYRALYGAGLKGGGLWVRPSAMFNETAVFEGREQKRFRRVRAAELMPADRASAQALIAHLRGRAQRQGVDLDSALRAPPPEPGTCCGRGCHGCVWEGYYHAVRYWADDALERLG